MLHITLYKSSHPHLGGFLAYVGIEGAHPHSSSEQEQELGSNMFKVLLTEQWLGVVTIRDSSMCNSMQFYAIHGVVESSSVTTLVLNMRTFSW